MFGLKIYELVTLVGLFVGPLIGVVITLWSQARSAKQERQTQTLRMLINTRHLPADPAYSVGINMVPIEFNGQQKIMNAWSAYMASVRYRASEENRDMHNQEISAKQTQLIFEIAKHLGYRLSETEIQTSAYASQGFVDREALHLQAQLAWIRIANALEGQNTAAGLPRPPDPSDLIPEQPNPEARP